MRYLILAIFVYLFYLLIRFLLKLYLSGTRNKTTGTGQKKSRSKIDLNKIEEADYEEVKTPKKEN
jgi:hypothetical protein